MKFSNRFFPLVIFCMLCLLPLSLASYPDYNVDYVLKNNVGMNNTNLGTIIIDKTNYISKTHNLTNFTGITIQRYDEIRSNFSEYVKINSSTAFLTGLQAGETYKFSTAGTYKLYKSNNASEYFNIVVNGEDALKVKLNISSDKLSFNYNKDEQTVSSQYVYNFSAILNSSIEPGSYPYNITIITKDLNKSVNKTIFVDEYETWTFGNSTLQNVNLSSDTYKSLGVITLTNNGNKNYELRVNVTGDGAKYLNYPSSINTYKGMPIFISFLAQVPSTQPDGVYPITINLYSKNQTETYNYNITIKDTILPVINNVTIDNLEVRKPFYINLLSRDNVGVEYCTIQIDNGNVTNMSKDQLNFWYNGTINTTGNHQFNYCLWDVSNNTNCTTTVYSFTKMKIVDYNVSVIMLSTKLGRYSSYQIMNINYTLPTPINVTLKSYFTDELNITDYYNGTDIRIVDGDGSKYSFTGLNSSVMIKNKGKIFVEIRGRNLSSYDGTLSFRNSDLMEDISDINFRGKFIDYDLPSAFMLPWFWNTTIKIDVDDTGYFETSRYLIREFSIPIGTDLEDLAIPTTVQEKKYMDEELQLWKDKFAHAMLLYVVLVGCTLGALTILAIATYYFSVLRRRMVYLRQPPVQDNDKDKEKKKNE